MADLDLIRGVLHMPFLPTLGPLVTWKPVPTRLFPTWETLPVSASVDWARTCVWGMEATNQLLGRFEFG